MKKLLAIALVGMLVLTGCGKGKETPETPETPKTETSSVKVGTGIVSGIKVAEVTDKPGKFETNVTFVVVTLKDDKIESVSIDTAQNAVQIAEDGTTSFTAKDTKKGRGDADYGMNWGEQIADLEEYLVGKTVAEIELATAESDLNSTVSISIEGYITAVKDAVANAVEVENVAKVASVATVNNASEAEKLELDTTIATVALDADGKIVYAFVDEAQLKGTLEGNVATADEMTKTKGQRGDADYGMNWSEQVKALTDFVIGKTADEVSSIKEGADVASTVSIYIGGFVSTLEAAVAAAK